MSKTFLYHQIAANIRQDILNQTLTPGDRLPSVREMAERWGCTVGTIQRAYEQLAQEGVLVSRAGQGTRVAAAEPVEQAEPLRRANLIHRAEAFLLEVLTAGYTQAEAEQAVRVALERWRTLEQQTANWPEQTLRFVGSHDPAVALITTHFAEVVPDFVLQLSFTGSLGGLMALADGRADLAGIHLWDEESDTYNTPFVRRLLPGQQVALLTVAHRRLGLAVLPANPRHIAGLADLARSDVRFANRQRGAGTRVWLDAHLRRLNIAPEQLSGYSLEAQTHSEVARLVVENKADTGLLVESAAITYGLQFIPLTTERYDLAIPIEAWQRPPVQALANWLVTSPARRKIAALGGYIVDATGAVEWVRP
ncbi:MAG: hypothetical protein FOGNACKC_02096 [Anaerolineae bacterium]|nr:hypothetical protein [Anaerolineae bacterium]